MTSRCFKLQLKDAAGTVLESAVEATVTPQGVLLSGGPVSTQLSPLTWAKLLRVRGPTPGSRWKHPNIPRGCRGRAPQPSNLLPPWAGETAVEHLCERI